VLLGAQCIRDGGERLRGTWIPILTLEPLSSSLEHPTLLDIKMSGEENVKPVNVDPRWCALDWDRRKD